MSVPGHVQGGMVRPYTRRITPSRIKRRACFAGGLAGAALPVGFKGAAPRRLSLSKAVGRGAQRPQQPHRVSHTAEDPVLISPAVWATVCNHRH
ncbi:MAG: hypothetical protein AAGF95_19495 [Chloroflexota bacterium]